jgi:hypothetical protein
MGRGLARHGRARHGQSRARQGYLSKKENNMGIKDISIESTTIYEILIKAEVGDIVSYSSLSKAIGVDVQKEGRGYLETARREAQTELKMVFGTVWNKGVKRLNNDEIISTGETVMRRIRKTSRRGLKKLMCVSDVAKLSNEEKVKMYTQLSVLGMLHHITRKESIKKVTALLQNDEKKTQLTWAKTLEAFKPNGKIDQNDKGPDGL